VTTSDDQWLFSEYEGQMGYPVWGSHLGFHGLGSWDYIYFCNLFIFFLNTFDFEVDDKSISLLEKFLFGGHR